MSKEAMKLLDALMVKYSDVLYDQSPHLAAQFENAIAALREALADQPAQQRTEELLEIFKDVDQCGPLLGMGQPAPVSEGLEMVDDEGENQAVRMFLALYGGQYGITAEQMRKHLKMAGFDNAWPEWANSHNGHLTKAGAQLWIRHLFALAEQPAQQQEPTDSMGMPVSCGKPLCSPGDHHPLCKLAAQSAPVQRLPADDTEGGDA